MRVNKPKAPLDNLFHDSYHDISEKKNVKAKLNSLIRNNRIIVFNCTEAWAPICIYLYVSGQNESVQLKPIDTLFFQCPPNSERSLFAVRVFEVFGPNSANSEHQKLKKFRTANSANS